SDPCRTEVGPRSRPRCQPGFRRSERRLPGELELGRRAGRSERRGRGGKAEVLEDPAHDGSPRGGQRSAWAASMLALGRRAGIGWEAPIVREALSGSEICDLQRMAAPSFDRKAI